MKHVFAICGTIVGCIVVVGILDSAGISTDLVSNRTIEKFGRSSHELRASLTDELGLTDTLGYVNLIKGEKEDDKNIVTLNLTNNLKNTEQYVVQYAVSNEEFEKMAEIFGSEQFSLQMASAHKSTTTAANRFNEDLLADLCDEINSIVCRYDPIYVCADGQIVVDVEGTTEFCAQ